MSNPITITITGLLGQPNVISRRTAMAEAIVYGTDKTSAWKIRGFALGLLPQHLPVTVTGTYAEGEDVVLVEKIELAKPIDKKRYFEYIDDLKQYSIDLDACGPDDPQPKPPCSYNVITPEYDFWMRKIAGSKKDAQPLWEDVLDCLLIPAIEHWALWGKPLREIPEDIMHDAMYPYPIPHYVESWRTRMPDPDEEKTYVERAVTKYGHDPKEAQATAEYRRLRAQRHRTMTDACHSYWIYSILSRVLGGITCSQAALDDLRGYDDRLLEVMGAAEELIEAEDYTMDPMLESLLVSHHQARIGQALYYAGISVADICKLEATHKIPVYSASLPCILSYIRYRHLCGDTVVGATEALEEAYRMIPKDLRGSVEVTHMVALKGRPLSIYDSVLRHGTAGTAHGEIIPDDSRYGDYGHVGLIGPVKAERIIADILDRRQKTREAEPGFNAAAMAAQLAGKCSPDQVAALQLLLSTTCDVKVLTGGPGTGKTTTLRMYLDAYQAMHPAAKIALCAPTGRAAQRMKEQTGRQALTIHKLLDIKPFAGTNDMRPRFDMNSKLPVDLLVCDEASMLTSELAAMLLAAIPMTSTVLLIGDPAQLPAIGAGDILRDLLALPDTCLPKAQLTTQHRSGDIIGINARAILLGRAELGEYRYPSYRVFPVPGDQMLNTALAVATGQVLAPKYAGDTGIDKLNEELRKARNPGPLVKFGRRNYRPGDPVIFLRNNYCDGGGYMNGDIGTVLAVNNAEMTIDLFGQQVTVGKADSEDIRPAYCISVHKAQGSEADDITVVLPADARGMITRNLLYTAVTRARRSVTIICEQADGSDAYLDALTYVPLPRKTLLPVLMAQRLGCRVQGDDALGEDLTWMEIWDRRLAEGA